jgi:hypothetical protein
MKNISEGAGAPAADPRLMYLWNDCPKQLREIGAQYQLVRGQMLGEPLPYFKPYRKNREDMLSGVLVRGRWKDLPLAIQRYRPSTPRSHSVRWWRPVTNALASIDRIAQSTLQKQIVLPSHPVIEAPSIAALTGQCHCIIKRVLGIRIHFGLVRASTGTTRNRFGEDSTYLEQLVLEGAESSDLRVLSSSSGTLSGSAWPRCWTSCFRSSAPATNSSTRSLPPQHGRQNKSEG